MMMKKLLQVFIFLLSYSVFSQNKDEFLRELYDKQHETPAQRKYRKIAPMPAGVVYIQEPTESEKEMRQHFRLMRQLGFNALKQILASPGWTEGQIAKIALEEGIIPFWYGEGGWEEITDELLSKLGIPKNTPIEEVRKNPKMLEYQKQVLLRRIDKMEEYAKNNGGKQIRSTSVSYDPEVGNRGTELTPKGEELFIEWCKKTYGTIENLNKAYNQHIPDLSITPFGGFKDWEDFKNNWKKLSGREYRHIRDLMRFKADHGVARIKESAEHFVKNVDKEAPYRGGGEMSLYLPAAYMGVDMEAIAEVIKDYGSFYPSQHFAWHYEQTDHEIVLPFYQQASLMHDFFKGGWVGGWESSGGPQQISGEPQAINNGYYVDGGTLLQFYLSQMAAGFRGFGIWCWNARIAGGEAGEYSLLDRNGNLTDRAITIGKLAQAMQKYRDEIWQMRKEPLVGILWEWENDAMWAALSTNAPRENLMKPIYARIGVSRALQNANIPFEYVTAQDIRNGLAARYKIIYLPAMLALSNDVFELLSKYVEQGGRLVCDMPSLWFDEYARLIRTGKGSTFEKTFGATLNNFQYSGNNRTFSIGAIEIKGFMVDLTITTAKTLATYNYNPNKPAIIENKLGRGTSVLLGYEASLACHKPNQLMEEMLLKYTLGNYTSPYECEGAIVYRLASPKVDYYFFINDGESKDVKLQTPAYSYKIAIDAISGEKIAIGEPIRLEAHSARWLRFEK
ncbi:MAG: beta-galactosidase trimerization domain-containing protein [Cytophagales bacterium]|nr:beta-galactosidase trimerization domain-containing protein [Cytophagales bacterium]MDW8383984.1 beta-galactosidase trimerization domain-containing protein [Flammeovirgaceae bacterium]